MSSPEAQPVRGTDGATHPFWSPNGLEIGFFADGKLKVADASLAISELPANEFDAVLHDPPRFAIAGELYSQAFYDQLARVLRSRGKLFHYTGTPNKLTSGRDLPQEVATRLKRAGFATEPKLDGIFAIKKGGRSSR